MSRLPKEETTKKAIKAKVEKQEPHNMNKIYANQRITYANQRIKQCGSVADL